MRNIKRNVQQGFTLIELMIVIAIVAILVALAVPAYQDYVIRAKFAECVNSAAPGKLAISEYRMTDGTEYPTFANAGFDANTGVSEECLAYSYADNSGILIVSGNTDALGITGNLSAALTANFAVGNDSNINWDCTSAGTATGNVKYLPSSCRGT